MAAKKPTGCIILNTLNEDVQLSYKNDFTIIPPKGRITVNANDVQLDKLPAGLKYQLTEV